MEIVHMVSHELVYIKLKELERTCPLLRGVININITRL